MRILSKLYRCFCHGLKICMWFWYSPQIFFYHFFHKLNLVIFSAFFLSKRIESGYLVCATPPTVLCRFFQNLIGVLFMVWRYACGLDIVLRFFFGHFFHKFNLAIFQAFLQSKWIDSGYLVCATPPTVLCRFFRNFTDVFVMVWRYACGLDIVLKLFFVTFSASWT